MSDSPISTPPEPVNPWSPSAAKKAYSAGVAGLIVGVGAAAGPVFSDGVVSGPELATLIGAAVVGFIGAFFSAWLPSNRN